MTHSNERWLSGQSPKHLPVGIARKSLNSLTSVINLKLLGKGKDFFVNPYTYNKVYYGIEELSFAEYIERYYEYCVAAKKLMKVW